MMLSDVYLEYKWYAGSTDEFFNVGPCDTREEIISEGAANYVENGFYIIQAKKTPLKLSNYVDIDLMLENADELACDMSNEDGDPVFALSSEQQESLSKIIEKSLDEWQREHNVIFLPHVFTDVCNQEYIKGEEDE